MKADKKVFIGIKTSVTKMDLNIAPIYKTSSTYAYNRHKNHICNVVCMTFHIQSKKFNHIGSDLDLVLIHT